ncbi:MAG TPA: hypothetical protein VI916_02485 [Acidimicrobiia bacterium]|nr:hypothetical protein [Acidimicrobiia bacterium]
MAIDETTLTWIIAPYASRVGVSILSVNGPMFPGSTSPSQGVEIEPAPIKISDVSLERVCIVTADGDRIHYSFVDEELVMGPGDCPA